MVMFILSHFLYNGFISENVNHEGKIHEESDLLHMYVKGGTMKGLLTSRIFIENHHIHESFWILVI